MWLYTKLIFILLICSVGGAQEGVSTTIDHSLLDALHTCQDEALAEAYRKRLLRR